MRSRRIVPFLMATLLAACGVQSPDEMIDAARSSLAKGDNSAAVTYLKAALAERPSSAEGRMLLGTALMNSGDMAAASVELRKGYELQPDLPKVVPLLVKAMAASGNFQKVVDEFGGVELNDPTANADVQGHVAYSHLALGDRKAAHAAATKALQSNDGNSTALITLAQLSSTDGKPKEAMAWLDQAVAKNPKDPNSLSQKGMLQYRAFRDNKGAIESFKQVITLETRHAEARSNLLILLLAGGDVAGAKEQFSFFKKNIPNHPQTAFFEAAIAYAEKDYKRALEPIQNALKAVPDNPQVLLLSGVIHFENRMLLHAERNLSRALTLDPSLSVVRQQLAETYLLLGNSAKALSTIEPMIGAAGSSARAHVIAGEAFVRAGDINRSISSFSTAYRIDPGNAANAAYLTLAKSKSEPLETTIAELRKISSGDKGTVADLALVSLLMKSKDYAATFAAIDVIEKKLPASPVASNLRGYVHLRQGDIKKARASFEQALKVRPDFLQAALSLGAIDVSEKRIDAARARFEEILKADPKNVDANLAIAKLLMNQPAARDDVVKYLGNAIKADKTAVPARLLLVNHYLDAKDNRAALAAAQEAFAVAPENPDVIDALGRSQVVSGEVQQATNTYSKLVSLQPNSPFAHVRLAGAHLAAKNRSAAEQSLRKALAVSADFVPAQQALIGIAEADNQFDKALDIAKTVIRQRPKEPIGYVMAGSVEVSRRNFAAAAAIFKEGVKKSPNSRLAASLYSALVLSGSAKEAEDFAKSWIAQRPKDDSFLSYLGDSALANKDYVAAERYFNALVSQQPENPTALNNLAWSIAQQRKKGGVQYAEKAAKLVPGNAGLLDTLATAHAAEGNLDLAIKAQKEAIALAPNDLGLKFHLAQFYVAKGSTAEAKAELLVLEKQGTKLPVHAEVQKLLKSLN